MDELIQQRPLMLLWSSSNADAGVLLSEDSTAKPTDRREVWLAIRADCCNAGETQQQPGRA
jgi:hypothetical protein